MLMTLGQAQALVPGSVRVGDAQLPLQRVHSDTRTLQPGDLFVALKGDRFDGHDFLAQARASGAVAALASRGLGAELPGLQVDDPLAALQQLAAGWRQHLHLPLVAVVGSNGKTTVTQMLGQVLQAWHPKAALATAGNLNNHIGVPLMLLRLRQDDTLWHRAAVLELGMNHPGEIALLARLAAPQVAVVNNAQREHQEFLAGVAAVAEENGQVLPALPASGTAVLPAADAFLPRWRALAGSRRVLTFADRAGPDTTAADVQGQAAWDEAAAAWTLTLHTPWGVAETRLHQAGRHNVHNALAAAAGALAAGAPLSAVADGIRHFRPVAGRSRTLALQRHGRPLTLVDDSYNANPDSVLAAIALLAALPGPRWLLLGDMGEVGEQGPLFHAEVGAAARASGIEQVWTVGALSAHAGAHRHFGSVAGLLAALPGSPAARSVLVKGSRFMKMEQVVAAFTAQADPVEGGHAA